MTRLKQTEFMAGIQPMYVDAKFDIETSTHGNAGGFVPSAAMFYVTDSTEEVKFGLAFGSYLGLGLDYGDSWGALFYY